jgi:hypothetical protein
VTTLLDANVLIALVPEDRGGRRALIGAIGT